METLNDSLRDIILNLNYIDIVKLSQSDKRYLLQ